MDLSLIIVSYNVKEFLEQAILSVERALEGKGISYEIFVVDNASQDGSVSLIRKTFPEVNLIANTRNLGFAAANNQALKKVQGQYIALLNPDTVVQEDTFTTLIKFFENHPEAGMVGCKILNADGSLQLGCRRSYPTPWVAFTRIMGLSYLFPRTRLFGRYNLTYLDSDVTHEVEAISGSFMMIRHQTLEEVGLLDERFFMYGEDLDWCYRVRQAGWKIYYVPETKIIHFKGQSSQKSGLDNVRVFYQAMRLFVGKHFRKRYFFLPQWFLLMAIWFRAAISILGKILPSLLVPLIDLVLLNLSLTLALLIRFGHLKHLRAYVIVTVVYSAIWLSCFYFASLYNKKKFSSSGAALAVVIGLTINASLTFFFKQYAFSRAVVLISGILNLISLSGWRMIVKFLPRIGLMSFQGTLGRTLLGRRTLVVGTGESGKKVVEKLRERVDGGYEVAGLVSFDPEDLDKNYSGLEILGTVDNIESIIHRQKIQEVIFSTDQIPYNKILEVMSRNRGRGINFKLVPSNLEVIIGKATIDRIGALPLVDIDYKLERAFYSHVKRLLDMTLSLLTLMVTLPLMVYARFFKGWKLTRQTIWGAGRKPVKVYRFDAPGVWLPKLPYLWSVLKGDLSLVGSEIIEAETRENLPEGVNLKPGLTGLVQLNKSYALNREDRERYHLYYLKNYSPFLDLEILLKSIFKL